VTRGWLPQTAGSPGLNGGTPASLDDFSVRPIPFSQNRLTRHRPRHRQTNTALSIVNRYWKNKKIRITSGGTFLTHPVDIPGGIMVLYGDTGFQCDTTWSPLCAPSTDTHVDTFLAY